MNYVLIGMIAMTAATVQTATGFGYAMICMSLWVFLIPLRTAAVLEVITVLIVNLFIVWRFRKDIHFRLILWPLVGSFLLSPIGVFTLMSSTETLLRRILGVSLLGLSIFLAFYEDKVRIKSTPLTGLVVGAISGFCGGLMGIGGPPIAIYYLSVTEDESLLLMRHAFPHSKRSQRDQIVELPASVSEQQDALLAEKEDPLSAARGICFGLLLLGFFWAFVGLVLWMI